MGYVYILKGANSRFYIGSTINLKRRLAQHEKGHTATTKQLPQFQLAFHQSYPSLLAARRIEKKLKRMKRKDYLEKIIADGYIKIAITPSSFNG